MLNSINKRAVKFSVIMMLAFCGTVNASTKAEVEALGDATWAGFQCASISEELGNKKDYQRLFEFGFKNGQAFLEAKSSINPSIDLNIPEELVLGVRGPTTEFKLVRIYERAYYSVMRGIVFKGNWQGLLINLFREKNCALIGK